MDSELLPMLEVVTDEPTKTFWFALDCCVRTDPELTQVFVGGYLVGAYATGDVEQRNRLVVGLNNEGQFRKGKLAQAVGLTRERVWQLQQKFER